MYNLGGLYLLVLSLVLAPKTRSTPSEALRMAQVTPRPVLSPGHLQEFTLVNTLDVPLRVSLVYNYSQV